MGQKRTTFHVSQIDDWQGPVQAEPDFRSQNDPVADERALMYGYQGGDRSMVGLAEGVQRYAGSHPVYRAAVNPATVMAARTMGAPTAMMGGYGDALLEAPSDPERGYGYAVGQGLRAAAAAPFTPVDEQPAPSKTWRNHGMAPGVLGGFALDAFSDPTTVLAPEKLFGALPMAIAGGIRKVKGAEQAAQAARGVARGLRAVDDVADATRATVGAERVLGDVAPMMDDAVPMMDDARRARPLAMGAFKKVLPEKHYENLVAMVNETPGLANTLRWLHPSEVAEFAMTRAKGAADELVRLRQEFAPLDAIRGAILGGQDKRGWYKTARVAVKSLTGTDEDADMLMGLMAALSPQNGVEMNAMNTARFWRNWELAGRPETEEAILGILGKSVQGKQGAKSVLDAWKDNTVRAASGGDTLSGPKVDSFWRNLRQGPTKTPYGDMDNDVATTLDAWMSNLFGAKQEYFAGTGTDEKLLRGDPGRGVGYLAGTAHMREASSKLGLSAAEGQEMAWSWGKALYEKAEATGMSAREIIEKGLLTQKDIVDVADFATLLSQPKFADIFSSISPQYAERVIEMKKLAGQGHTYAPKPVSKAERAAQLKAADVLDRLRGMRERGSRLRIGENKAGTVLAAVPSESMPGRAVSSTTGQLKTGPNSQSERFQNAILDAGENARGENRVLRAALGDRVTEQQVGAGRYKNSAGQLENNKLRGSGVELRLDRRGKVIPRDERDLETAMRIWGGLTGQEVVAHHTPVYGAGKAGAPKGSIIHVPTPNRVKVQETNDISSLFPGWDDDSHAVVNMGDHLNVARFDGSDFNQAEAQSVENFLRGRGVKNVKMATLAANAAGPTSFQRLPWGDVGSRQVTEDMLRNSDKLPASAQRSLDSETKGMAADILATYEDHIAPGKKKKAGQVRPDYLNLLKVVAQGGISGLRRALGDASQLLPALAAIGLLPGLMGDPPPSTDEGVAPRPRPE